MELVLSREYFVRPTSLSSFTSIIQCSSLSKYTLLFLLADQEYIACKTVKASLQIQLTHIKLENSC